MVMQKPETNVEKCGLAVRRRRLRRRHGLLLSGREAGARLLEAVDGRQSINADVDPLEVRPRGAHFASRARAGSRSRVARRSAARGRRAAAGAGDRREAGRPRAQVRRLLLLLRASAGDHRVHRELAASTLRRRRRRRLHQRRRAADRQRLVRAYGHGQATRSLLGHQEAHAGRWRRIGSVEHVRRGGRLQSSGRSGGDSGHLFARRRQRSERRARQWNDWYFGLSLSWWNAWRR